MQLDGLKDIWDIATSLGAVLIPAALYYIKMEVTSCKTEIGSKHDIISNDLRNHIANDDSYNERNTKELEKIVAKLDNIRSHQ